MATASAKSDSNSEIINFMEELSDFEDEEMPNENADSGPRPYMYEPRPRNQPGVEDRQEIAPYRNVPVPAEPRVGNTDWYVEQFK